MNRTLRQDDLVRASSEAVACDFDEGLAILNLGSGTYFSVNSVGASIWQLVQSPIQISDICDAILAEYDIDESVCRTDVEGLVTDLKKNGLVEFYVEETA